MCNPAFAQIAVTAITTVVGAAGQYAQGQAESTIETANAQYATANADAERIAGAQQEQRMRQQIRARLGSQRAAIGAAGSDTGSGTGLQLQQDTAMLGEQDALTIRANAYRRAAGYDIEAWQHKWNAKMARRKGNLGAFSTLLGGGMDMMKGMGGGMAAPGMAGGLGGSAGEALGGSTPVAAGVGTAA